MSLPRDANLEWNLQQRCRFAPPLVDYLRESVNRADALERHRFWVSFDHHHSDTDQQRCAYLYTYWLTRWQECPESILAHRCPPNSEAYRRQQLEVIACNGRRPRRAAVRDLSQPLAVHNPPLPAPDDHSLTSSTQGC